MSSAKSRTLLARVKGRSEKKIVWSRKQFDDALLGKNILIRRREVTKIVYHANKMKSYRIRAVRGFWAIETLSSRRVDWYCKTRFRQYHSLPALKSLKMIYIFLGLSNNVWSAQLWSSIDSRSRKICILEFQTLICTADVYHLMLI